MHSRINLLMGQFKSKLTIARPKSTSLRTTVPEGVVQLIDLKAGDELIWTVTANKGAVVITLSKG